MITTPPGLYYLSLAYVASLFPGMRFASAVQSLREICSTGYLRSINAFLAIICSILIYDLIIYLRPSIGQKKATIHAILIALYPVHWFFTFLYYTDVASVAAALAMYLASSKKQYFLSALLGALATLLRQTNIVWMLFVAVNAAVRFIEECYPKDTIKYVNQNVKLEDSLVFTSNKNPSAAPALRQRKANHASSTANSSTPELTQATDNYSGFSSEVLDIAFKLWYLKWKVVATFAPFLMVLVAFAIFILWNGSIVLGAKDAHAVSPHFAQIMYFALVSAGALAPLHFSLGQVMVLRRSFSKNKISGSITALMVLSLGFIAVHHFSIAHPYLLADNRHYSIYLWRKVINAH